MAAGQRLATGANTMVKLIMSGILRPPTLDGPFFELAGIEGRYGNYFKRLKEQP
jgi:hypothetical protein